MNSLVEQLTDLSIQTSLAWYNNSAFDLYCLSTEHEDYVYSKSDIPANEVIGYIEGDAKNTWELMPDKYCIWIDDSTVIDCRKTPRCITSMIREGFFEGLIPNCRLRVSYTNIDILIFVESIKPIYRGEELIIYKDLCGN